MTGTAGLVLAAGAGRRYGGPKAPVVVDGERLIDRAVRVLREAGCYPVVVVLGAWVGDVPEAEVVVNDRWAEGMASSLQAGLAALTGRAGCTRAVVTLVDLPGLTPAAVRRVAGGGHDLALAVYDGEPGHPVLLAREHWDGVAASVAGDTGARRYLRAHDAVEVEVADVADGGDLDVAATP